MNPPENWNGSLQNPAIVVNEQVITVEDIKAAANIYANVWANAMKAIGEALCEFGKALDRAAESIRRSISQGNSCQPVEKVPRIAEEPCVTAARALTRQRMRRGNQRRRFQRKQPRR